MSTDLQPRVFGGKASVHLKYEGDISALAQRLSKGLMIPDFQIAPSEWPPHQIAGSVEALGWELWLEQDHSLKSFQFRLKMETEHAEKEVFSDQVHDLSLWLARYISAICRIDSFVAGSRITFQNGEAGVLETD